MSIEPFRPAELAALFGRLHLRPSMRCALAVSGGSDSTALMVLFAEWLTQLGEDIGRHTVLTVDHGLRPESAAEARAVAVQAAQLGFEHATLVWDGPKPQTGVQAAARIERYGLIGRYMQANAIGVLLTGHTRDDQAETVLMRLARGSGLDGLAGMAPRVHFSDLGLGQAAGGGPEIARPLLDVSRARLRAALEARRVPWIEDPSNDALNFERPRLRAARGHLVALGLTDANLALSATRLLRARRALEAVARAFCQPDAGAVQVDPCGYVTLDRARLQAAEEEIALRVLQRAVAAAGGSDAWIPMAKLEAMMPSLLGPDTGAARFTLSRAMITASDQAITVEREAGREPLPRQSLPEGTQAIWDGRFRVGVAAGAGIGPVEVGPLGEAAARDLRRRGAAASAPVRAAGLAPSFWQGEELLAAPALAFWRDSRWRGALDAEFLWPGQSASRNSESS